MLVPNIPIESDGKIRVTVIPAKPQTETAKKKSAIKRVAAYCRVSTAEEEQASSYTMNLSAATRIGRKSLSSRMRVSPVLRRRNARSSSK